ncbi:restriction endonuclease subunit S [Halomonas halodenitrificans]|uniref:restriction endonuclease subunit S n=1 Tax=Halomonas halodenitrificans TaxID=28252 RepID=UPI000685C4F1|nr:restriction endonuclease subunit S [Halomonas halodenitrificans]
MSFPQYPEYKDSGVEWLGEVPAHWDVTPVRAFVEEQTAKNVSGDEENYLSLMANVGVIPYAEKGDVGNKKPDDLSKCKKVDIGDLVINSMNYGIGSYGLSGLKGVCSPVYIVLRPLEEKVLPRYALRVFENKEFQKLAQSFGQGILVHRSAIGWDNLKNIKVPMPGTTEQAQLSTFLDHETSRIDALVEEQQHLIELLKEKRQAVISHAVNSFAEGPEGKLGHYIDLLPGYAFPSSGFEHDDGIRLLRGANVSVGNTRWDDVVYWPYENTKGLDEYWLKEGDLVIGMDRPWISGGARVARVRNSDLPALLLQRVARLRARSGLEQDFLELALSSQEFKESIEADMTGVSVPHVSPEQISSFRIALPRIDKQSEIAQETRRELGKIENLLEEASINISLMQEHHSALISAAVTGKIDVRGWQPPAGSTASTEAAQTEAV